jgi:hypothetical protein
VAGYAFLQYYKQDLLYFMIRVNLIRQTENIWQIIVPLLRRSELKGKHQTNSVQAVIINALTESVLSATSSRVNSWLIRWKEVN